MKPEAFEKQLQRQPLRPVPPEWRAEILQVARDAGRSRLLTVNPQLSFWREWLWPCPQAWGGLAAVWLLVLGLNLMPTIKPRAVAQQAASPRAETEMTLAAQRRELARLLDNAPEPVPASKASPSGPRSELVSPAKV